MNMCLKNGQIIKLLFAVRSFGQQNKCGKLIQFLNHPFFKQMGLSAESILQFLYLSGQFHGYNIFFKLFSAILSGRQKDGNLFIMKMKNLLYSIDKDRQSQNLDYIFQFTCFYLKESLEQFFQNQILKEEKNLCSLQKKMYKKQQEYKINLQNQIKKQNEKVNYQYLIHENMESFIQRFCEIFDEIFICGRKPSSFKIQSLKDFQTQIKPDLVAAFNFVDENHYDQIQIEREKYQFTLIIDILVRKTQMNKQKQ